MSNYLICTLTNDDPTLIMPAGHKSGPGVWKLKAVHCSTINATICRARGRTMSRLGSPMTQDAPHAPSQCSIKPTLKSMLIDVATAETSADIRAEKISGLG